MSEIEEVNKNPEFRVYMTEEEDRRKIFKIRFLYIKRCKHGK